MGIDVEAGEAKTAGGDSLARKDDAGATTPRPNRTARVLGGLAALLIAVAAIYYFVEHRTGTEVATETRSERPAENPAVTQTPRPPDSMNTSASPATPSRGDQSPQPSEQQQSVSAPPLPPATAPVVIPAAPPAATASSSAGPATPPATIAQDSATNSQAAGNERPSDAASPDSRATPPAQPSMRDQPAALPDQSAPAPKKENILVVMRGPANIRSAPGKQGRVIGTAPRDATVKELDRSGNWVQVETQAGTGWINAALLGSPESR